MNINPFLGEKKLKFVKKMRNIFVFKLFPKFSVFFNSNDCIGKNHIKIYQAISSFYLKYFLNSMKKGIISCEKIRNSSNYNHDYAPSYFENDF